MNIGSFLCGLLTSGSLRVEHVKLKPPNILKLDFLGKASASSSSSSLCLQYLYQRLTQGQDSMRYKNKVPVDDKVYRNIGQFMKGKEPGDELFDRVPFLRHIFEKHIAVFERRMFNVVGMLIARAADDGVAEPAPEEPDGRPDGEGVPHVQRVRDARAGAREGQHQDGGLGRGEVPRLHSCQSPGVHSSSPDEKRE